MLILVHLVHFVHLVIANLDNFTIKKSRKYFIETKTFIKISIIFKNLFKSIREKLKVDQKNFVVREKILVV